MPSLKSDLEFVANDTFDSLPFKINALFRRICANFLRRLSIWSLSRLLVSQLQPPQLADLLADCNLLAYCALLAGCAFLAELS